MGELLAEPDATFLLVTSPQRDAIDEAIFFRRRLRDRSCRSAARSSTACTRAPRSEEADGTTRGRPRPPLLGDELGAQGGAQSFDDHRRLAGHDRGQVERLLRELGREPLIAVPLLDDDVHDVAGLAALNEYLFAADAVRV